MNRYLFAATLLLLSLASFCRAENLVSISELATNTATDDRPDGGPVTWTEGPGGNIETSHEPVGYEMGNSYLGFDMRGAQWDYLYAEPDAITSFSVSLALQDLGIAKNIGPGRESFSYTLFNNSDREVYDTWFANIETTSNPLGDFGWDYFNGRWYGQFMYDIDEFKPPFIYRQNQSVPNDSTFVQGDRLAFTVTPSVLLNDTNRILTFALRPNTTAQFFTPGQGTTETWGDIRIDFTYDSDTHTYIHKWEYVDSADPEQGKQQSRRLVNAGRGYVVEPGANLSDLDLSYAYLHGAMLQSSDLTSANFSYSHSVNADLSSSTAAGAVFNNSDLQMANLRSADLTGASFASSDLRLADFTQADLTNADLTGSNLQASVLTDAVLLNTRITNTDLRNTQLPKQTLMATHPDWSGVNMDGFDLSGLDLSDRNFEGISLASANLSNTDLGSVSFFGNANLANADLSGSEIYSFSASQGTVLDGL